jgi:hypothetical protein
MFWQGGIIFTFFQVTANPGETKQYSHASISCFIHSSHLSFNFSDNLPMECLGLFGSGCGQWYGMGAARKGIIIKYFSLKSRKCGCFRLTLVHLCFYRDVYFLGALDKEAVSPCQTKVERQPE